MVLKEQLERVRVLRLANPSNVLNRRLLETLLGEVGDAAADPAVRCLRWAHPTRVIFPPGSILMRSRRRRGDQARHFLLLLEVYRAARFPKPTLAAIGGTALLGGWILAMARDFRLISDDGKIALSEIRFDSPTAILVQRLSEISTNPTLVKVRCFKGRTLRADEGVGGRIRGSVFAPDKLQEEALREARLLSKQAPLWLTP